MLVPGEPQVPKQSHTLGNTAEGANFCSNAKVSCQIIEWG